MTDARQRVLLVEGDEDKRVIPALITQAGLVWTPQTSTPIVHIESCGGVESLLVPSRIETHLKSSGLRSLGVLIDADESASNRWSSIRARILSRYPDAPVAMSEEGVVLRGAGEGEPAFGAWIMPDNSTKGMLETFLLHLRPTANPALLRLARTVVREAAELGAPFSPAHQDKAEVYSWLAWQKPPGRQLHDAIMNHILVSKPPCYWQFVRWFCRLYELELPK
jgi:hypothetical protein